MKKFNFAFASLILWILPIFKVGYIYGKPLATARCMGGVHEAGYWGPTSTYTGCESPPESEFTDRLKAIAEMNDSDPADVLEEMEMITSNTEVLTSTDIIYSSQILQNIAATQGITTEVSRRLLGTLNNLLNVNPDVNKEAQRINKAQTRTLRAVEYFSNVVDLKGDQEEQVVTENVAMKLWGVEENKSGQTVRGFGASSGDLSNDTVFEVTSPADLDANNSEVFIYLPDEVLNIAKSLEGSVKNVDLPVRLTYFIFKTSVLFLSPSQLQDQKVYQEPNSKVVSGSISGLQIYNLTEPVVIVFKVRQTSFIDRSNSYCAYWDFETNDGFGNWSTNGCYSNGTDNGRITCLCNHLTNFAILTDFRQGEGISSTDATILGFITIIGLCLSLAGLGLTILSFILFRKLRKGRSQKVLVNLAVALICTNIVFLVGIERTGNYNGCIVVAALLHYFLLAAFLWMLMEGILQYLKFVKVLDNYVENFMWKAAIPSWGLPAVVVATVAGIDYKLYRGPDNYCWLDLQAFYYAFMAPVGVIILINAVLFVLVVKGITCDRPKHVRSTQSDRDLAWLQCRAGICCFVVLGLTWVFGFFAIEDARIVFQYLFCIFNALQGFLIFIFHNIREPAVRKAWLRLCCKGENDKKYLSSSDGINTDSTGGKTSSDLRPSAKPAKKYDNVTFNGGDA